MGSNTERKRNKHTKNEANRLKMTTCAIAKLEKIRFNSEQKKKFHILEAPIKLSLIIHFKS